MCQSGSVEATTDESEASTMKVTTVGLDLAKNVFQVHGADERGHKVFNRQLKHAQMMEFFVKLPPCVVATAPCAHC